MLILCLISYLYHFTRVAKICGIDDEFIALCVLFDILAT